METTNIYLYGGTSEERSVILKIITKVTKKKVTVVVLQDGQHEQDNTASSSEIQHGGHASGSWDIRREGKPIVSQDGHFVSSRDTRWGHPTDQDHQHPSASGNRRNTKTDPLKHWIDVIDQHFNQIKLKQTEDANHVLIAPYNVLEILNEAKTSLHDEDFKRLTDRDTVKTLVNKCQQSVVLVFRSNESKSNDLLERFHIPYVNVGKVNKSDPRNEAQENLDENIIRDAVRKHKFPVDLSDFLREKKSKSRVTHFTDFLFSKPRRKIEDRITMRTINVFQEDEYTNDWVIFPRGRTNRFLWKYPSARENIIQLYFHVSIRSKIVQNLLSGGITVNGEEYNFLGCSSEGLKLRKCLLWKGSEQDVEQIITDSGKFDSGGVSKRMARIGLLFSELSLTNVEINNSQILKVDDAISFCRRYNFTDGCGGISFEMASLLTNEINRLDGANLNPDVPPSVYKVRLQGLKGVLALNRDLKGKQIMVRPSMKKFDTDAFPKIGVCDYSKPFTFGRLNRQYITLLSGLGIEDHVLENLQKSHSELVMNMSSNAHAAIMILQWQRKSELAKRIIDYMYDGLMTSDLKLSDKSESLPEEIKGKIGELQKDIRKVQSELAVLKTKNKKIKILVPNSRYIFGVCDPYGLLGYGECYIRVTTEIDGRTKNIRGPVVVCKPPCYLLGDVRVLNAVTDVDYPELSKYNHLVDCIVFPIRGQRPHPNEIAGSDLDGDTFFVSWEEGLVPKTLVDPYDYPAASTPPGGQVTRQHMINYFANQNQVQIMTGKIDQYFRIWSNIEGARSKRCQQLGMQFSRLIDATKTGASAKIPSYLISKELKDDSNSAFIWNKLSNMAETVRDEFKAEIVSSATRASSCDSGDIVWEANEPINDQLTLCILNEPHSKLREFDKFRYAWVLANDKLENFLERYMTFIDSSQFSMEEKRYAIEHGVPEDLLLNDISRSKLLHKSELERFSLESKETPWKFYFRKNSNDLDWSYLIRALTWNDNTCLVIGLPSGVIIVLQFHFRLHQDLEQTIEPGSITALFFSRHFGYRYRNIIGSDYQMDFTDDILQIYRNNKRNQSFVWLKTSDVKQIKGSVEFVDNVNSLSVDLSRFNKQINQNIRPHPLLTKARLSTVEIFVRSDTRKADTLYYDVIDSLGDFPYSEEIDHSESYPDDFDIDLLALVNQKSTLPPQQSPSSENIICYLKQAVVDCSINDFEALLNFIQSNRISIDTFSYLSDILKRIIIMTTGRNVPRELIERIRQLMMSYNHEYSLKRNLEMAAILFRLNLDDLGSKYLEVEDRQITLVTFLKVIQNWQPFWYISTETGVLLLNRLTELALQDSSRSYSDESVELKRVSYIIKYGRLHCLQLIHTFDRLKTQLEDNPLKRRNVASVMNLTIDADISSNNDVTLFSTSALPYVPKVYSGQYVLVSRHCDALKNLKAVNYTQIGHVTNVTNAPFNLEVKLEDGMSKVLQDSLTSEKACLWKIDVITNIVTYLRVVDALNVLERNVTSNEQVPMFDKLIERLSKPTQNVQQNVDINTHQQSTRGEANKDPSSGKSEGPTAQSSRIQKETTRFSNKQRETTLDGSQHQAVLAALSNTITCITGPPGTGKSKVAQHVISEVIRGQQNGRILVVAESNNAIDNLARQLRKKFLIVRIGPTFGISQDLYETTLEGLVKQLAVNEAIDPLTKNKTGELSRNVELCHRILKTTRIVLATCSSAGDPILQKYTFSTVLVDEASVALETTLLCSLVRGCNTLVLIGDKMQLSPVVNQSQRSLQESNGLPSLTVLTNTLFHRLLSGDVTHIPLNVQYRMHPSLIEFPSNEFYNGSLISHDSTGKLASVNFMWPDDLKPFCFIHCNGREKKQGTSYCNNEEANIVSNTVTRLLAVADEQTYRSDKLSLKQITVLTFYQAQVTCILDQLRHRVAVHTVDSFQGCENDVIIASTVRANENSALGFSGERNRLNVLFTRAKRGLIIVGNQETLLSSDTWRKWLAIAPKLKEEDVREVEHRQEVLRPKHEKPHTESVTGRKARRQIRYKQH